MFPLLRWRPSCRIGHQADPQARFMEFDLQNPAWTAGTSFAGA